MPSWVQHLCKHLSCDALRCSKDYRYDQILHKNEQLYRLLAITVSLCPPVSRWCEDTVQVRSSDPFCKQIHSLSALGPFYYWLAIRSEMSV